MRKPLITMSMAIVLMVACAVPTFAHGHGHRRQQCQTQYSSTCENACQASCEDGFVCGTDGHYCSEHRNGETCEGYTECGPVYSESHHHHGRH